MSRKLSAMEARAFLEGRQKVEEEEEDWVTSAYSKKRQVWNYSM